MNTPKNAVIGRKCDHHINPRLLDLSSLKYHIDACGIDHKGLPIVMWTAGSTSTEGSVAGEHDGIRSSAHSGSTNMSKNYVYYSSQQAWVDAGNEVPE